MAQYKMDIVDVNLNTGNIHRSFLSHTIGQKDEDADRFGVRAFRDGVPVDLSGCSCHAWFLNSQGTTLALTDYGTVDGNEAYVTLPQACYDYDGQFCLAIKIVGGGISSTVRIIDGVVDNIDVGGSVSPTSEIPDYSAILSQYAAMVAATSAANTAIAETFDATKAYPAGKYVINTGALYRLTADHAANVTWSNTSKVAAKIGDDVSELKSAINNGLYALDVENKGFATGKNLLDPNATEEGYMSAADGRITQSSSYLTSDYIPIASGQKVTISPKCRKFLAFDITKTAIQATYVDAGTTEPYTFTASADGYVRISYLATDYRSEQVEYGDTATTYEAYKIAIAPGIELNDAQKEYIADQLEPLEDDIDEIKDSFTQEKSDKIDFVAVEKTANNEGYYNQNGAYDSSSSYFYSDLIPVASNDRITVETLTGITTYVRFITAYSDAETVDRNHGLDNQAQSTDEFTIASGVNYIRVSLYTAKGTTQKIKIRTIDGVTIYYANTEYVNPLTNKKWVACGDSFTQGDFSGMQAVDFQFQDGKYKGKNKVYPYFIGLHTGAEIVNEAISGSTMAYVDGTHHEFSAASGRYTQIPNDADYITLYFGINDSHHQIPIGTISDNTNTTFYGAWNVVMQYLITNHPNAKIGIIISNGCDTIDYPNAEIAIAKKYGVAYLDMNSDYHVPILFRVNGKPDTSSAIIQQNYEHYRVSSTNGHPNPAMHEYESTIIQHWLEGM